jgi:MoaA/NifB/PqqE/SkfB family radical SAM enzyme
MPIPIALARRAAANYLLHRAYCASFELTYNCNARCQHCHRGPEIPRERLATPQRLLEICREIRPIVAIMSGGEPLIRKELDEIVRTFRQGVSPLRIFVNTNGALLTAKRFLSLKDAGVDEFLISFDFPDERHDEWRAIPGLFKKIENFVTNLAPEDRTRVVLTCVFTSRNYREAPRMAEVALDWGVNINFSAYTWMRTNDMSLLIPPEEIDEFRRVVRRLLDMKELHGHILTSDWVLEGMARFFLREDQGVCRAGERSLVVNPDGTFSPCGLLIRDYPTRKELLRNFTADNTCTACYTSTRANSERPARYLFLDHVPYLTRSAKGRPGTYEST